MASKGEELCEQMANELIRRGCDFTLLFWLRQAELLSTMGGSCFARDLLSVLSDLSIDASFLGQPEMRRGFFTRMRSLFNRMELTSPVSPRNYVFDKGLGGKDRCIQKAKDAGWPRPHQSFCFQTRGPENSYFFIYQCWQDALHRIHAILSTGHVETCPVTQIYEHCWGDSRLSRLLIDWEIETAWFGDLRTPPQIRSAAEEFPRWFVGELIRIGALASDARVRCVVKDKSRAVKSGQKVSFHFIFDIAGIPKGSHQRACARVFERISPMLRDVHKEKNFALLPREHLDKPWIGVDWRTMSGSQGFSVPGSRKSPSDPLPRVAYWLLVTREGVKRTDFSWSDQNQSVVDLDREAFLQVLYHASYTPASAALVSYTQEFLARDEELVREVTRRPKLSVRPPPGKNQAILPKWFESELIRMGGYTQNTTMPCIQKGTYIHQSLHAHLAEKKNLPMAHVLNMPCPSFLTLSPPVIHVHRGNGVYAAVDQETV